jgi:RecB family exonuclease
MEISFTQFRVYRECPWKYKLLFVDRKKIPLKQPSSLGLSLHKALEAFHRAGAPDLEKLLDCYEERWVGGGYASASERDEYFEKGLRILERYFAQEAQRRTSVEGIEKEFFYPLGAHLVRGMVDRLDVHPDGKHEVIDYKTRLDPQPEGTESAWLQLRFYGLGLKECLGISPASLTIHYLSSGKRETVPYDQAGEEALKADILAAADGIEAGKFVPDTAFCRRCDFRKTCTHSIARDS